MKEWTVGKTQFGNHCRIFRNHKFTKLNNGYYICWKNRLLLSHAIWDKHHPKNKVKKDEAIHHINKIRDDDRIANYEKFTIGKHLSIHQKGSNNSMYGKIGNFRQKNCDWNNCNLPHRKGGLCTKHYGVYRYWTKKGLSSLDEIKKYAYRPINETRKRDKYGRFIHLIGTGKNGQTNPTNQ